MWSVHDAIALRTAGVEAAVITTTAFQGLARAVARSRGYPELPLLVLEHPLGGIDEATISDRAQSAHTQVLTWLAEIGDERRGTA